MAKIVPYEAERKQSVLQEYEILKALHHERIMALHEAYITPRYLVLICENCAGKEILYSIVDRYWWAQGHRGQLLLWGCLLMPLAPRFRYSEDDVVSYVLQLLQGLEYLHGRRIVHLDIKPDNIIISGTNALKIIDFGSAQTYNPLVLRQLGRRAGTLEYMCEWGIRGAVAWGRGQGQNWGMLFPKACMYAYALGGLGNGEELCPWGRWEAFGVLGVSAENFYSIAGVSGRVWVLWGSWCILGRAGLCQGAAVSGRGAGGCNSGVLWLLWVLGCYGCWGYCGCWGCWGSGTSVGAGDTLDAVGAGATADAAAGVSVYMTDLLPCPQRQRW